jgi:hypothetical protein
MDSIERDNHRLKGVLPKDYARPALDKTRLGELVDLIGDIGLGEDDDRSKDILGRVYEYFLGQFASKEGKKAGEFYTPRCVVRSPLAAMRSAVRPRSPTDSTRHPPGPSSASMWRCRRSGGAPMDLPPAYDEIPAPRREPRIAGLAGPFE